MNNNGKDFEILSIFSLQFTSRKEEYGTLFIELAYLSCSPLLIFSSLSHKKSSNYLLTLIMNLDIFETRFIPISILQFGFIFSIWDQKANFPGDKVALRLKTDLHGISIAQASPSSKSQIVL